MFFFKYYNYKVYCNYTFIVIRCGKCKECNVPDEQIINGLVLFIFPQAFLPFDLLVRTYLRYTLGQDCILQTFLHVCQKVQVHTGLNISNLSHPRLAQFSWRSKPNFRSCGFTASYLFEMFFTTREKCCYMLIFANECPVLIESFETGVEATPFCIDGANSCC